MLRVACAELDAEEAEKAELMRTTGSSAKRKKFVMSAFFDPNNSLLCGYCCGYTACQSESCCNYCGGYGSPWSCWEGAWTGCLPLVLLHLQSDVTLVLILLAGVRCDATAAGAGRLLRVSSHLMLLERSGRMLWQQRQRQGPDRAVRTFIAICLCLCLRLRLRLRLRCLISHAWVRLT
jgi:hypothetical protein